MQEVADNSGEYHHRERGQIVNKESWGPQEARLPHSEKKTTGLLLNGVHGRGSIVNALETQYRRDERVIRFLTFKQDKYAVEYSRKRRVRNFLPSRRSKPWQENKP